MNSGVGGDQQVGGEAGFLDCQHPEGAQIEQLQLGWANLDSALGEDFKAIGIDLHRVHAARAEQFCPKCLVVAVEVRNMKQQLAGCRDHEGFRFDGVGLCLITAAGAHAAECQSFLTLHGGAVELQVGKRIGADTKRLQCLQPRLQLGHPPDLQSFSAGFQHKSRGCGTDGPQHECGHGTAGVQCGANADDVALSGRIWVAQQCLRPHADEALDLDHRLGEERLHKGDAGVNHLQNILQHCHGVLAAITQWPHDGLEHLHHIHQHFGIADVAVKSLGEAGAPEQTAVDADFEGRSICDDGKLLFQCRIGGTVNRAETVTHKLDADDSGNERPAETKAVDQVCRISLRSGDSIDANANRGDPFSGVIFYQQGELLSRVRNAANVEATTCGVDELHVDVAATVDFRHIDPLFIGRGD